MSSSLEGGRLLASLGSPAITDALRELGKRKMMEVRAYNEAVDFAGQHYDRTPSVNALS